MDVRCCVEHYQNVSKSDKGFYGKYPTRLNPNPRQGLHQGYFEDLLKLCALGFEPDNSSSLVDTTDSGILDWDRETMTAINKWNLKGTQKEKQLHLVSYLFEFIYDLMIAPADNVSVNPGIESESCHGFVG